MTQSFFSFSRLAKCAALFIIFLMTTIVSFAQAPQLMSYQTIVRDNQGKLVQNTTVSLKISIIQSATTGSAVYVETQSVTTNVNGLASLSIGAGAKTSSAAFSAIDWSQGPYFIKTEIDITGGSNYTLVGTNQLQSVPYALYAASSGSAASSLPTNGNYPGEILYWNGTKWIQVDAPSNTNGGQVLTMCANQIPSWNACPISNSPLNITTGPASNITTNSATVQGFVSSSTGSTITGIWVSANNNPPQASTLNNGFYYNTTGQSNYSLSIMGLSPTTTYYAYAFLINPSTNQTTFAATPTKFSTNSLPQLALVLSQPNNTTESMVGTVTANGNTITTSGVCYGTSNPPTLSNSILTNILTNSISTLTGGTTYYASTYATSNGVTYYSTPQSFIAPLPPPIIQFVSEHQTLGSSLSYTSLSQVNLSDVIIFNIQNYNTQQASNYSVSLLTVNGVAIPASAITFSNSTITVNLDKSISAASGNAYFASTLPGQSFNYSITVTNSGVSGTLSSTLTFASLGVGYPFNGGFIVSGNATKGNTITICSPTDVGGNGTTYPFYPGTAYADNTPTVGSNRNTGAQNTIEIISLYPNSPNNSTYAAGACDNLEKVSNQVSNWYLPANDEMWNGVNALILATNGQTVNSPNISTTTSYWTSTLQSALNIFVKAFTSSGASLNQGNPPYLTLSSVPSKLLVRAFCQIIVH